jgi:hypothetical protein
MNNKSQVKDQSRLAFIATVGELHTRPLKYDLKTLQKTVLEVAPDLLCVEVTKEAWEKNDLSDAFIEVKKALWPLSMVSDIVIVPIASSKMQYSDFWPETRLAGRLSRSLNQMLWWGIRLADSIEAINGYIFGSFCHTICEINNKTWTAENRHLWEKQNEEIAENIIDAVYRDSGRRVLVVVQCHRIHSLLSLVKKNLKDATITSYKKL